MDSLIDDTPEYNRCTDILYLEDEDLALPCNRPVSGDNPLCNECYNRIREGEGPYNDY